jgi:hypothetical protein
LARGGKERRDDLLLSSPASGVGFVAVLDASSGSASQLSGGRGRAAEDRRYVVEWNGEEVVKDECEALGGSQRVEHNQ